MSFVGSLFSDDKGAGFQAQGANLQTPTTDEQAAQQYKQSQDAIAKQQDFVNAINAQNPQAIASQNFLTNQLQNEAQGIGPNPAQAALDQNTAANVAATGAAMAGARGSSGNVGLMARQIGQQGAQTQQQAVGQSATMQAGQQLNAQNALQNLAGSQIQQGQNANTGYANATQGSQANVLNSVNAQNTARVGNVAAQNPSNASIAQGNQAAQSGLVSGVAKGLGSMIGMAHGGKVQNFDGGGMAGLGVDTSMPMMPYVQSPNVEFGQSLTEHPAPSLGVDTTMPVVGPSSNSGQLLQNSPSKVDGSGGSGGGGSPQNSGAAAIAQQWNEVGNAPFKNGEQAKSQASNPMGGGSGGGSGGGGGGSSMMSMLPMLAMLANKGGRVPAMVSPGEEYLGPDEAKEVAAGKKHPFQAGKVFPGKPKVKGDSVKNDTIPTELEPGGVVIPNHIMQSKDAGEKARKFVEAVLAQQSKKRSKK